jgi:hypothetical protein
MDAVESAKSAAAEPIMGEGGSMAASAADRASRHVCVLKTAATKVAASEMPATEMPASEMSAAEVTEVPAEMHASKMAASEPAEAAEAAEVAAAETSEVTTSEVTAGESSEVTAAAEMTAVPIGKSFAHRQRHHVGFERGLEAKA